MNPFVTAILILIGVSIFGFIITGRASALAHMKFVNRFDRPFERLKRLLKFGLGQKRMVDPEEFKPGLAHVIIFAAFLVVQLRTLMLFAMGFSETWLHVVSTPTHFFWSDHPTVSAWFNAYLLVKDLVAITSLIGVLRENTGSFPVALLPLCALTGIGCLLVFWIGRNRPKLSTAASAA